MLQWTLNMKVKVAQSCLTLKPHGLYSPWNSPGQNTGVGRLSLLQGIFPTQGLSPGLPHCRWILYHLSHKGSPRILEWVAYPFSSRSSRPRNQTRFWIAGGFFTNWAMREMRVYIYIYVCVCVCVCIWISVFVFFGYIPWREITGLHDSFIFKVLKAGEAGSCYWWGKLSQAKEFPLSTEQGQPGGWKWCRQNETILPIFFVWLFSIFWLRCVAKCAAVHGVTKSWHDWATELNCVAGAS